MKIGTTLAILHISGNTPVVNDLFIRVDKGMENDSWISFKIFVNMLFDPKLLLFFKVFYKPSQKKQTVLKLSKIKIL